MAVAHSTLSLPLNSTALLVGGSGDRSPVTGDYFRGIRQFHVLLGRLSL